MVLFFQERDRQVGEKSKRASQREEELQKAKLQLVEEKGERAKLKQEVEPPARTCYKVSHERRVMFKACVYVRRKSDG